MGAYGAALYGRKARPQKQGQVQHRAGRRGAGEFPSRPVSEVRRCGNHCQLTVNTFADGRRFISGNRCDRPVTGKAETPASNLYAYKQQLLAPTSPCPARAERSASRCA
jgi:hypothetical protein